MINSKEVIQSTNQFEKEFEYVLGKINANTPIEYVVAIIDDVFKRKFNQSQDEVLNERIANKQGSSELHRNFQPNG